MTNLGFSCCCFFLPPPLGRRRILMKGSLVVTVWHRCFFLSSTSQGYFKILNSYMFLLVIITKILFCWEKINKRGSLMKRSFTVNVKHLNIRFSETILFFSYLVKPGITLVMSQDLGSSQIKILVSVDDKILRENLLECANQLFL